MSSGLLQIHDPLRPKGPVVGIDLGTTNSLVAAVVKGSPRCIPVDERGGTLLPSVVHYAPDGSVVVGAAARALAAAFPTTTLASVKRFMGKGRADAETRKLGAYRFGDGVGDVVRFEVAGGAPVTPIEVSAEILRTLKRRAEAYFSARVEQAVVTVPAYFDDAQRQATKDAGRIAGLEVLRLVNEPTAAALAYGLDKRKEGIVAVYDLGGGTFDVSILQLVEGVFQVKATGGNSALGGDDFDRAIAERVLAARGQTTPTPAEVTALLAAARSAKETLTTEATTTLALEDFRMDISRAQLEAWIAPWVEKTGPVCRRALKDAGLTAARLDGVILVGGATRVPAVGRYVEQLFGKVPLGDIDPDQVVALGAAVQADLLTNAQRQDEVLLLDVIPLSLGLETMGGVAEKLIPRNTTIPTAAAQVFTTFQDGQTAIDLHVVQGERELVADCRSLARFRLSGLPSLAAGMTRVEVRFEVNADGLLSVSAREQATGVVQAITVKPTHGLTDEQVEQMLLDSIEHAEEDVHARLLAEQRVEAERILAEAAKQLRENGDLLGAAERSGLESGMAEVRRLAAETDADALREAIHALDEKAKPFIELVMNRAMNRALAGHSMDQV
jgi:molecular chaperone HscA